MPSAMALRTSRLTSHRRLLTLAAVALAVGGGLVVAWEAGWDLAAQAFDLVDPAWVAMVVLLVPVALIGYAVAYRSWSWMGGGPRLTWTEAADVVTAGFGPFTLAGGFRLDHRLLCGLGARDDEARRLVIGLGALEYAVLAPAACVAAIILLVADPGGIPPSLLWPWALAAPGGLALGVWLAAPQRRRRVRGRTRLTRWIRHTLDAVGLLREAIFHPVRHRGCWLGMTLYWTAEIGMLFAAARLFGVDLGPAHAVIAYATGYTLTRRSMPLGGAGATEILLALSLHWVGVPLARALPVVVAYRVANLLLPAVPALLADARLGRHIARARDR
jgi:uncharacterized membrane protein YbhN (UPF0104 family)